MAVWQTLSLIRGRSVNARVGGLRQGSALRYMERKVHIGLGRIRADRSRRRGGAGGGVCCGEEASDPAVKRFRGTHPRW
jgi:hypothetical protein